jgi:hypothetical protein
MTAVQWLEKQYLLTNGKLVCQDFEYAEKLEKQQIIDAYHINPQETMYKENTYKINANTYITNEEEIKKGDWFLEKAGRQHPIRYNGKEKLNFHCKKIILTTDQDLIKDGVATLPQQEISDEQIEKWAKEQSKIEPTGAEEFGRIMGAKWYREQIKQPKND